MSMDFISLRLIFVIAVLVVVLGYWAFNFIVLYHLARFGIGTQPKKLAAVFLFGSVILFSFVILFFANLDLISLKNNFEKLSTQYFNTTYYSK